jgi:hypothetical protein
MVSLPSPPEILSSLDATGIGPEPTIETLSTLPSVLMVAVDVVLVIRIVFSVVVGTKVKLTASVVPFRTVWVSVAITAPLASRISI